jgi:hypothetical protein
MKFALAVLIAILAVVGIVFFSAMKTGREIQDVKKQKTS